MRRTTHEVSQFAKVFRAEAWLATAIAISTVLKDFFPLFSARSGLARKVAPLATAE